MTGKPYIRDVPRFGWFLRQPRYMRYMAREVTCLFIGAYAVVLLVALQRLAEGRQAYEAFLQALASPVSMVFHLVVLVFALYHTTSWFNVTPKAMPIQAGEDFLPGAIIVGAHYAAWLIVSVALLFLAGVF
ncbi:MAG: fumarate reductase subunit [Proteobacteria bacterium]|nr:fumarate reductase subunit [Pseudomonadota bacterium]RPJ44689.1 MAG: fumarate reductase subunit C [Betaproteobacteria bacterium]